MRKILLGSAIIAIISSNALAMEIYKGKITKHKEWTTGNAKIMFKPALSKNTMSRFKDQQSQVVYMDSMSSAYPSRGTVGTATDIQAYHDVFVGNHSSTTQTYYYTLSLCSETTDHTTQCGFYYDEIDLEPGGYFLTNEEPSLQVTIDKPGIYRTNASTFVGSFEGNSRLSSNSNSISQLEIVEGK